MVQERKIGRLLFVHGVLMLSLGMVLFSLGNVMTRHNVEEFGYTVAVILTSGCLLAAGSISYRGGLWNMKLQRGGSRIYLFVGAFSIACGALFWIFQSATEQIHGLAILTVFYGIYWGIWNLGLTIHLQDHPHKGSVLCVFAAITSALSLILATEFQFTDLSAVTALACFTTLIGIQGLVIAIYLRALGRFLPVRYSA